MQLFYQRINTLIQKYQKGQIIALDILLDFNFDLIGRCIWKTKNNLDIATRKEEDRYIQFLTTHNKNIYNPYVTIYISKLLQTY